MECRRFVVSTNPFDLSECRNRSTWKLSRLRKACTLTDPQVGVLARRDEEDAARLRAVHDGEADVADLHCREVRADGGEAGGDVETAHCVLCSSVCGAGGVVEWRFRRLRNCLFAAAGSVTLGCTGRRKWMECNRKDREGARGRIRTYINNGEGVTGRFHAPWARSFSIRPQRLLRLQGPRGPKGEWQEATSAVVMWVSICKHCRFPLMSAHLWLARIADLQLSQSDRATEMLGYAQLSGNAHASRRQSRGRTCDSDLTQSEQDTASTAKGELTEGAQ